MIAISTDNLAGAERIVSRAGIPFLVLYDPEAEVVRDYGVYDLLGDGLAAPATFVVDGTGFVRWSHVGSRISDRAAAGTILEQLRRLS